MWYFLFQHWDKVVFIVTVSLTVGYWLQVRLDYSRKQFLMQVNFSLNTLEGDMLVFPTLFETSVHSLMLNNDILTKIVIRAARQTTKENPFIKFRNKKDRWLGTNELENAITVLFQHGFFAADMGLPVKTRQYVFALTCEKGSDIPMEKIRVMLVSREILERLVERRGHIRVHDDFREPRLKLLLDMRERLVQDQNAFEHIDVKIMSSLQV